jgi:hypothetical protein
MAAFTEQTDEDLLSTSRTLLIEITYLAAQNSL